MDPDRQTDTLAGGRTDGLTVKPMDEWTFGPTDKMKILEIRMINKLCPILSDNAINALN